MPDIDRTSRHCPATPRPDRHGHTPIGGVLLSGVRPGRQLGRETKIKTFDGLFFKGNGMTAPDQPPPAWFVVMHDRPGFARLAYVLSGGEAARYGWGLQCSGAAVLGPFETVDFADTLVCALTEHHNVRAQA